MNKGVFRGLELAPFQLTLIFDDIFSHFTIFFFQNIKI